MTGGPDPSLGGLPLGERVPFERKMDWLDALVNRLAESVSRSGDVRDHLKDKAGLFGSINDVASDALSKLSLDDPRNLLLTSFFAIAKLGLDIAWSGVPGGAKIADILVQQFVSVLYNLTGHEGLMNRSMASAGLSLDRADLPSDIPKAASSV